MCCQCCWPSAPALSKWLCHVSLNCIVVVIIVYIYNYFLVYTAGLLELTFDQLKTTHAKLCAEVLDHPVVSKGKKVKIYCFLLLLLLFFIFFIYSFIFISY